MPRSRKGKSKPKKKRVRRKKIHLSTPSIGPVGVPGMTRASQHMGQVSQQQMKESWEIFEHSMQSMENRVSRAYASCSDLPYSKVRQMFQKAGLPHMDSQQNLCTRLGRIRQIDSMFFMFQEVMEAIEKQTNQLCKGMKMGDIRERMMAFGLPLSKNRKHLCTRLALAQYIDANTRQMLTKTQLVLHHAM